MSLAALLNNESVTNANSPFASSFKPGTRELTALPEPDDALVLRETCPALTPLWSFRSRKGHLKALRPVVVRVRKEDGTFWIENENLGIYEIGETREEAMEEFSETLVHFYFHYARKKWSEVVGQARKRKKFYEELFLEVAS